MPLVEIYTADYCPYCTRAKKLLNAKGVVFTEYDVSTGGRDEMTRRANGRTTVPQIFIDDFHVGGCDDLHALDRDGRLDPLLAGQK